MLKLSSLVFAVSSFERLVLVALALAAWAVPAAGQSGAPVIVCPETNGGESEAYYAFDPDDGHGILVDRLRRSPQEPRVRSVEQNLFALIGRSTEQPAGTGEIFFQPVVAGNGDLEAALYVETPIGYAAYFEPANGPRLGEILTFVRRPFEPIASTDGNYALLMRRDRSGKTEGAYLYHATDGKAIYLGGLDKLDLDPEVTPVDGLPALGGRVAAAEVHADSRATSAYLVVDPASGEVHLFDVASASPRRVVATKTDVALYDVFPRDGGAPSPRRFLPVAIQSSSRLTRLVLVLDAASGMVATLVGVAEGRPQVLQGVAELDGLLGQGDGPRSFSAVPNTDAGGKTEGLWVLDSRSGQTIYLDNPGAPSEMRLAPVRIVGR
jgi:hypothetical protein